MPLQRTALCVLVLGVLERQMIPYHGFPVTPQEAAQATANAGHVFISHEYKDQLWIAAAVAQSMALDNGAFTAWKQGRPITDWSAYYTWVSEICRYPIFDFAVIPDVIDGDEKANDALLAEWPWGRQAKSRGVGAPVWHMHESIARLQWLAKEWPRVCIGSSGDFATVGNSKWWNRMAQAMNAVCDDEGLPLCKLHGLRMLNPEVFSRLPLASADSTNIAQNVGIDSAWRGTYTPASKATRARVMRERIEGQQALIFWEPQPVQMLLAE